MSKSPTLTEGSRPFITQALTQTTHILNHSVAVNDLRCNNTTPNEQYSAIQQRERERERERWGVSCLSKCQERQ